MPHPASHRRSHPRPRAGARPLMVTVLTAGVLALGSLSAPAIAGDPAPRSSARTGSSPAERALHSAQRLFSGGAKAGHPSRDATLVLNRLVTLRGALSPADRRAADALLARPTDRRDPDAYRVAEEKPVCGPHVCIHYVTSTGDRVPGTDTAPANGIPDFVDSALATVEHVHQTYHAAGYRSPKKDGTKGGNKLVDVYLADVGSDSLYGYCTSDQKPRRRDLWAYCVLDNDYKSSQFPVHTPLENLQVTAAHEYFHAVQFAYDFFEDRWFMEATATWAEDELYTDVNDNVFYLKYGQLKQPLAPLDFFNRRGLNQYGNWIFFRYLTERFPASSGGMPTLVRSMWRLADAAPRHPNLYSTAAIKKVLAGQKTTLPGAYALFSARNRFAPSLYAEGSANHYPKAPIAKKATLSPSTTRTSTLRGSLDHLTSYAVAIAPSGTSAGWKLKVVLDMADRRHSPMVVVDRVDSTGGHHFTLVKLSARGTGSKTVGFDASDTQQVVVTLVNAGTSYRCHRGTPYSCAGKPLDNDSRYAIRAVASH